ncbi:sodium-dependent serotonin transporter-like [Mizuhopecten yessoensis]|uniref:sodium-dependent serotonin transporter-like n=1 Tax=Mizuhopecten yessoensis TaxID=6573 RepID=UPI000B45E958|nr:sodium-dependent serotonin transporter-like [Mizuhopecten yessoensis]
MSRPIKDSRGKSIHHTYDNTAFTISYPFNENGDGSGESRTRQDLDNTEVTGQPWQGSLSPPTGADGRAYNLNNKNVKVSENATSFNSGYIATEEESCFSRTPFPGEFLTPGSSLQSNMSQSTPFLTPNGRDGVNEKEKHADSQEDLEKNGKLEGAAVHPERETWGSKVDFLLSVIGFAVDLGNVWRFPYICYKNGGGAFLIPYIIMLVFLGIPLFYMELALGQYQRCGAINVWQRICPMFTGIGYGICFVATFVGMYYNTIIAYALYYLVMSFRAEVPWTHCGNHWNTEYCVSVVDGYNKSLVTNDTMLAASEYYLFKVLEIQKSNGVEHVGPPKWDLLMCLLGVFVVVYFCLWKGIKSSGKAVWVTATLPYVVLLILLVRGCTLPGATTGILYYLRPQWYRLKDVNVWLDAATQVFFSLGPGFGTLLALSSYNKFNNNCYLDAMVTSVINCLTSFLAGFVVFSVLGYMALLQGRDIDKVAVEGPGLVFVVYPEAIASLDGSIFWSIIFFLMLITLGLDSTFGGLEAVITAVCDNFGVVRNRRELFVLALVAYCFIGAISTTTYGGTFVINLLDRHAAPISLIFICFCEAIAVSWFYGVQRFSNDIKSMIGFEPGIFWKVCWVAICPVSLFLLFVLSIWAYSGIQLDGYVYPDWSVAVGWCITCSSLICIPLYIVCNIISTKGTLKQKLLRLLKPASFPAHVQGANGHAGHDTYEVYPIPNLNTQVEHVHSNSLPYITNIQLNGTQTPATDSTEIF